MDTVIHLAALLSATAEDEPLLAWNLNMGGLMNALEVSRELGCQCFTPQDTRGLRFPGLISYMTPSGGGTTDYAVEIYYAAVTARRYTSYIARDTNMDMMYMPDALDAIIKLMGADSSQFLHRNSFNVTAMSIDPEAIAAAIREETPRFVLDYDVDPKRQVIADSWPHSINATAARTEWGFKPRYDLQAMTRDMLVKINCFVRRRVKDFGVNMLMEFTFVWFAGSI